MLRNYIQSKFRSLRDILSYIKESSVSTVMRLFNMRKKRYDDLISRMDSFVHTVHASGETTIDVSGFNDSKPKGKINGKSLNTVRFQDGVALPVMDFQVPNRQQLAKDIQMFDEAEQYIEELKEMQVRLSKKKDKATKTFLKEIETYLETITQKRDALYEAIEELTDRHAPSTLTQLGSTLMAYINETVPAEVYSEMGWDMYISSHESLTGKKNAPVEFTYYLYLDELNKDQFKSDQLLLVLTASVNEVKGRGRAASKFYMTFHMTALPKFLSPGNFDPGTRLTGTTLSALESSLKREANKLISIHSMMPLVGRRKLNVSQQQIRHSGILDVEGVVDVDVEGDEIVVELTSMKEDVIKNQVWPELIVYLRKVVRAPKKSSFVYNVEVSGKRKSLRIINIKNAVKD